MNYSDTADISSSWSGDISQAILALGTDSFYAAIDVAICRATDLGDTLLLYYPKNGQPKALYDCYTSQDEYRQHVECYLAGAYILDPYYQASMNGIDAGAYQLNEVAPDDFKKTEYYRVYYKGTGLNDEFSYLLPLPEGGHLHLSVAYTGHQECIPTGTVRFLNSITDIVNALLLRHWQIFASEGIVGEDENIHYQITQALGLFGSSLLTEREQAILQLILHGHSNKSASSKLDIAESTVKLHRKHMYEKFDISSQSELFHLFIDSLSCFNPRTNADPLQSYMAGPN